MRTTQVVLLALVTECVSFEVLYHNHDSHRVRVLSKKAAQDTVLEWAENDALRPAKQRDLLRSVSVFSLDPHSSVCYVALEAPLPFFCLPEGRAYETRALAMFHVVPKCSPEARDKLHLWAVVCTNETYGMVLFQSLVASNVSMTCEYTVDPLWRMEMMFNL